MIKITCIITAMRRVSLTLRNMFPHDCCQAQAANDIVAVAHRHYAQTSITLITRKSD